MTHTGNTKGKQPKPKELLTPEIANAQPPDWFSEHSRIAFHELLPLVLNKAKPEDLPAFYSLCLAYARIRESEEQIKESGLTIPTAKGFVKNPVWAVMKESIQVFSALCVKFALSPVDRARIENEQNASLVNDPMAELLLRSR